MGTGNSRKIVWYETSCVAPSLEERPLICLCLVGPSATYLPGNPLQNRRTWTPRMLSFTQQLLTHGRVHTMWQQMGVPCLLRQKCGPPTQFPFCLFGKWQGWTWKGDSDHFLCVYTLFSSSDLYNWKSQKQPRALINLGKSVFKTHLPNWINCQHLVYTLFIFKGEKRREYGGSWRLRESRKVGSNTGNWREAEICAASKSPNLKLGYRRWGYIFK